ncbi:E3 ubiquitin-protein ligase TRAIP [Orussus abietinus]|uniref:E3 ubiquitin-protein ligase TRAIP n=1 Tax=Orussus abietinus TaxID=222816 RepID=UPI000C715B9A|nr:E3 ubiquitin-protein ligase TRAIP [Orussus abietinus]
MNLICVICSELLTPSDEAFSTPCGHVFHLPCVTQWLERSKTCPQCRERVTQNKIHRLYFNFSNSESIKEDPYLLQVRLDNQKLQLSLKNEDIKILTQEKKTFERQAAGLRAEVKALQTEINKLTNAIHALKEQVKYFKNLSTEADKAKQDAARFKKKLDEMRHLQIMLSAPPEDVDEMIKTTKDHNTLITYISVMKRELTAGVIKRRELRDMVKKLQQDITKVSIERNFLSEEHSKRTKLEEQLALRESENLALKAKVKELQTENQSCSSVRTASSTEQSAFRIPQSSLEQEAESRRRSKSPILTQNNESLSNSSCVEINENLPVPISKKMPEKSSQVQVKTQGIMALQERHITRRMDLLARLKLAGPKNPIDRTSVQRSTIPKDIVYDGFGGHSRIDIFPSSSRTNNEAKKVKRQKTNLDDNRKLNEFVINLT